MGPAPSPARPNAAPRAADGTRGLKVREQDGLALYSALGLGQIHYFYRSRATIVWLAADPEVARQALADTVRLIP